MPVQVFDNGVCTFSSITSGIMYAVHHGANVINLSLGPSFSGLKSLPVNDQKKIAEQNFKNEEKVWRKIFSIAAKKNVIIVFAAGNDDILACVPPENRTNNTLNVAAVGQNFCAAPFSNYGQGSNISAPGVHIYSAFPGNSFKFMDGTSMAAPMVTGVVALMKSLKPDITVSQALGVLQQTGKKVGDNIPVMIQVDRALAVVRSGRIPKGPVPSSVQIPASSSSCNDDAPMRRQLDELKVQRRALNKQIDELERKLKK
jgi:subtilisin family serine protease